MTNLATMTDDQVLAWSRAELDLDALGHHIASYERVKRVDAFARVLGLLLVDWRSRTVRVTVNGCHSATMTLAEWEVASCAVPLRAEVKVEEVR